MPTQATGDTGDAGAAAEVEEGSDPSARVHCALAARGLLGSEELDAALNCGLCREMLMEPVTGGCGHSFCRGCLGQGRGEGGAGRPCPQCQEDLRPCDVPAWRVNVLLGALLSKWFLAGRGGPGGPGCASQPGAEPPPTPQRGGGGRPPLLPPERRGQHKDEVAVDEEGGGEEVEDDDEGDEEPGVPRGFPDIPDGLFDPSDLECPLCLRLLYEAVTTPCGHSFCLACLERCLDHAPSCPLCKEPLAEYLARRRYVRCSALEALAARLQPLQLAQRERQRLEELAEISSLSKAVPVFVCTAAFPAVPCPLHVFEPRYRLMIRRCVGTGTRQFGMCAADGRRGFSEHGCLLNIRRVELFADGRSAVDAVGGRRFRVESRGERDGYSTADIAYLEDERVAGAELQELLHLQRAVYEQAAAWLAELPPVLRAQILRHFGPMPPMDADPQTGPDGPAWIWWLLATLPLDEGARLSALAATSVRRRLLVARHSLGRQAAAAAPGHPS